MSDTEYDVIVAGYGPVGETCANLLGYYGIKALILDKEKETYPLPRAITWDAECQRAMAHCNFLTKVKTRKIRGVESQGMILMAENEEGDLAFVSPTKDIETGNTIR